MARTVADAAILFSALEDAQVDRTIRSRPVNLRRIAITHGISIATDSRRAHRHSTRLLLQRVNLPARPRRAAG